MSYIKRASSSGPSTPSNELIDSTTIVAQENISATKVVSANGYLADKDVAGRERGIGIAKEFIGVGLSGEIVIDGIFQDASFSFTKGQVLFLGNSGNITTTPPTTGYWVKVGSAVDTDAFKIELQEEPIKL